ncbi:hypothetical protein BN85407680 [Alteracholeplasma palmae J233]|uniref:Uncharacterized protein n=1 Tax=Alteracholeplasma palmae (strain ATCC 49389 / J233) TaxID=1318466 RepID=U4KPW9_ALTPJ|nr:hypothetical protein [Alteracholeplasma palmae]CCV64345.1 hypothetical protein BN85407680 [Alteracholeplasma palmae J233]
MDILNAIVTNFIATIFVYYFLTLFFRKEEQGKYILGIFILYTLLVVLRIITDKSYIDAIGLIFHIIIYIWIFRNYDITLNGRKNRFIGKMKKEITIKSTKKIRKHQFLIGLIFTQIILVLIIVLNILEITRIKWYYLLILELIPCILYYLYWRLENDQVLFILGNTKRKLYLLDLEQTQTKLNQIIIDDRYIIDQNGKVVVQTGMKEKTYYVITLLSDIKDYQLFSGFKLTEDMFLEQIKDDYQRLKNENRYFKETETEIIEKNIRNKK